MKECERLKLCPFFNGKLANMPNTAEVLKKFYCLGSYESCARYMVFKAIGKVPPDLWPNETERAKKIISSPAP